MACFSQLEYGTKGFQTFDLFFPWGQKGCGSWLRRQRIEKNKCFIATAMSDNTSDITDKNRV